MKVKVNEEACIGCGACEAICPEVFELNDEGISTCKKDKLKENIEDEVKEKIQDAMDTCPTGAIVEEKENQAE
ncbi:MAG: ferredoxin [Bacilli bacterium]|nr:ferredoxin [Bacilli bacterium]